MTINEEYARRCHIPGRWAEEAAKAASFLQDHPGSRPAEIAGALELSSKSVIWVLLELTNTGTAVKTQGKRGIRYYLKGQKIQEEDKNEYEINKQIIKTAKRLIRERKGWGIRAKDIQYALKDAGIPNIPSNTKIAAVLRSYGYTSDNSFSHHRRTYVPARNRQVKT